MTSAQSLPFLPLLYRDDHIVIVDKPAGLHVHPTALSPGENSCMKILRAQLGKWVYPIHRLDRATSGVLLFALDKAVAASLSGQFEERTVGKQYLAVTRGYIPESGVIDKPLRVEKHFPYINAITEYKRLETVELPITMGSFPTARYSLASISPHTGRKNQIRKHFSAISHPLVGDVNYGDGRHNRLFREHFGCHRLLLHALQLDIELPGNGRRLNIVSPVPDVFQALFTAFGWKYPFSCT